MNTRHRSIPTTIDPYTIPKPQQPPTDPPLFNKLLELNPELIREAEHKQLEDVNAHVFWSEMVYYIPMPEGRCTPLKIIHAGGLQELQRESRIS